MKPSLIILAAGMGSRYGGLKQIDSFGPNGESIIDYSIYDAIRAGFGKVVFIIREHFKKDFIEFYSNKFDDKIEVAYVTQEISKVPEGTSYNPEREKPWGTAHAVLMAKDVINEPFAVVNADDFYGEKSFKVMADYLMNIEASDKSSYCTVAYYLKNTLSDHGTVNRGVCFANENEELVNVQECVKIKKLEDGSYTYDKEGRDDNFEIGDNTLVSMNFWGFVPDYFAQAEEDFTNFINERGHELKSEYYIPTIIKKIIDSEVGTVKIIPSAESWFGVTYKEDKPVVIEKINKLIANGIYPEKLW
ncbi:MAG: sugar phosphate nucleotidyltransferase [Bacteroidota bacterium]